MWHPAAQQSAPCTVASERQRKECRNTSIFLLGGHLRGSEKMKWGVGAGRCSSSGDQTPDLKNGQYSSGCFVVLFYYYLFVVQVDLNQEEQCQKCGRSGNRLLSPEGTSQELSESRESLPGPSPKRLETKGSKAISVHHWNELAAWQYAQVKDGIRTLLRSICSKVNVYSDAKAWSFSRKNHVLCPDICIVQWML